MGFKLKKTDRRTTPGKGGPLRRRLEGEHYGN